MQRVRILEISESVQAVMAKQASDTKGIDSDLELTIYVEHSDGRNLKFISPFEFETEEVRNSTFDNTDKMTDFVKAVVNHQMKQIDPEFTAFELPKVEQQNSNLKSV